MTIRFLAATTTLSMALVGCGGMAGDSEALNAAPADGVLVEELDLVQLEGDRLYVHSRRGVLTLMDVSQPKEPTVVAAMPVDGQAGEIFVKDGDVLLVAEDVFYGCADLPDWADIGYGSEVAAVLLRDGALEQGPRYCLPGEVVGSRLVGDILYVVTTEWSEARVFAFDATQPASLSLVDELALPANHGHEIHVTPSTLFVTQRVDSPDRTRLIYIDISDQSGIMVERGAILLPGSPQGRFHLDATADSFRLVTFDTGRWASLLHIVDIRDPDRLSHLGTSEPIGSNEELYATRFVGDRAYVVTFRETDPLWVLDLSDPTAPAIIGELEVPGWSDFIYPFGYLLLTVGRGDRGRGVALSAFDVSDPTDPRVVDRLELGDWSTTSEAIHDHRGVTFFLPGEITEESGLTIALPTWYDDWDGPQPSCTSYLQLVTFDGYGFLPRGGTHQGGAVRRTLPVQGELFSISDLGVASIDASDLDQPTLSANLSFAGAEPRGCEHPWGNDMMVDDDHHGMYYPFYCSAENGRPGLAILMTLGLLLWRRRRR